ncbi:MAG: type II secretion system F family protein [Blautia sp.]|nr:type II secretion system F family protein [Blautia sp.]
MASYKYKAKDNNGKTVKGILNAADETELQSRLKQKDLYYISSTLKSEHKKRKELKPRVLADFCRQISTLTAAGVSLARSLSIISRAESIKPKEKAIYEELLLQVRQGISLSQAMENTGGAFPSLMIYMFRSSETSGNLDQAAMKMAEMYEKEHRMEKKISSSLAYPKFLAVMVVVVVLILTNFVLPKMQFLLDKMEVIPASTSFLLGFSDFMQRYWYIALGTLIFVLILVKWLLSISVVRRLWHKALLHMPVAGKLIMVICSARFARTLSSLYAAGIPIVSSLQIARKTTGNDYIDSQFDEVIPYVRAGNNLSAGLMKVDGIVHKLIDSIMVGEETGNLDAMLNSSADAMEYDSDAAITKLVSYIEPVLYLVMGLIVAFVLLAIFNAIYGSYDTIGTLA